MNVSLYQAAASMNAQARWQELITQNLATGSVPGFRKHDMSFSGVEAGLPSGSTGLPHVMPSARSSINLQPGELRATGNPMDVALEGPGFFEVQMPNGSKAYTRDGELHLNAQGELVTNQGYPIIGEGGPLQFDANNGGPITIASTGDVSQGGAIKGRIRLFEFKDPHALTAINGGLFLADSNAMPPQPAAGTSIQQGFLEGSNTSPTAEMASLITSMRMFEANQKVLQMQDERMGKVLSELGNPA